MKQEIIHLRDIYDFELKNKLEGIIKEGKYILQIIPLNPEGDNHKFNYIVLVENPLGK